MKKTLATIGLACLLLKPASAQPSPPAAGAGEEVPANVRVPMDTQFRNTPDASDYPGAPALLVQDNIGFHADPDGSTSFEEDDVLKLFTADGIEDHRNFVRVYQSDRESVEVKAARTILPDGRILDIPKQVISDEPVPGVADSKLYKNFRRVAIRYPGLKPGALIEFHLITHRKPVPGGHWWNVTYVQNPEPMLSSTYNVTVPAGTDLHWATPGLDHLQPARTRVGNEDRYYWHVEKLKPFKPEPLGPPVLAQMDRIEVTNFASWTALSDWFNKQWELASAATPAVHDKARQITADARDDAARVRAVIAYIAKKETAPVATEDLVPHHADDMLAESQLSGLDAGVLASALLRSIGIQSTPVLAFDEPVAEIQAALPRVSRVDQVLLSIKANGKTWWLDTEHLSALLAAPPAGCQGMAALTREGFSALPDFDPDANRRETRFEATVDEEGRAEVLMDFKEYGDAGALYRDYGRDLAARSVDQREERLDQIFTLVARSFSPRARVHDRYFPLSTDSDKPFELATTLTVPNWANKTDNSFKLPLPVEPSERLAGLVSEQGPRTLPVRFSSPVREEIRLHLSLPRGSHITELPPTVEDVSPFGSFYATARSSGSEIWYYSRLVVLPTWFKPDQVPQLMEFAHKVVDSQTSSVTYTTPSATAGGNGM